MLKQQPPQMQAVCDDRDPAGDAAILIILHPGQENTHGKVFKPLPPTLPTPSLRGAVFRLGIHRREYYEGLVSVVSDDIGSGKGWVGGWGKPTHLHFKRGAAEVPRVRKSQGRQREEAQRAPLTFHQPKYLL